MLDADTKRRIDSCRDILVGKVPDPKSQVEQITIALIYKFMDDMDAEAEELGGSRTFFAGEYARYGWAKLMAPSLGGFEVLGLYSEAIQKMNENPGVPELFRDIFKNAYLPYRDPETLKSFLKEINYFSYDHSERLGDAFEYLLSVLGSQGDAGQFRTPRHIIDFMVEVLDPKKNETILDPACGTAGFLISAWKHILKTNTDKTNGDKLTPDERSRLAGNIKGYDISPDMVRLSLVNLYLHGFSDPHIVEYDTLTSDEKWNEVADVILANPPFMSPKGGIKPHKRFTVQASRSEVLFVDYMAEHLTATGRAAIVVPEGIIFQSGTAYKALRKMLVDTSLVAVVSLPAGVFNPYSGVKTSILILDKRVHKQTDKVLFVKVQNDGFNLGAQRRAVVNSDLPEATRLLRGWMVAPDKFEGDGVMAQAVDRARIGESGDFNLSGERYISAATTNNTWPMVELGQFARLINGRAYKQEELLSEGPTPVIRVGNFFSNRGWYYSDLTLEEDKYCDAGDLLYAWSASFGPRIWEGPKAIFHYHIWKIETTEAIDKRFLFRLLQSDSENIKAEGNGIAMSHATKGGMEQRKFPLPPVEIQRQIVAEIEGYQKIIDGARQVLDNYKPHIVVNPDWPVVILEDVIKLSSGEFLSAAMKLDGPHPVYGGNGINGYHNTYMFEMPTIVIGRVGAYCGAIHVTEPKSWITDNGLYVKEILKPADLDYLALALKKLNLNQYAKVGGQPSISQSIVLERKISLPDLETQRTIVSEIKAEQALVSSNRDLIRRMETKVKAAIDRVWGGRELM
jgi:type I restriction enzyme M protein